MRLTLILAAAVAASGCATRADVFNETMRMPDWDVCYRAAAYTGMKREAAWEVIGNKKIDCRQHQDYVAMKMNADANRTAQSLQMLQLGQQMQQPKVTPVAPVTCRSTTYNGVTTTNCN